MGMTGLGAESEEKMVFSKESGLRRFCVGCVAAVVLFAGCSGPRPSGLRGPAPKKGQEFRTESTFRIDDGKIVVRAGDTTIEGVFSLSTAEVEEGRILSVREREIEKEAQAIRPESIPDIHQAIRTIARLCDGARTLDTAGFSKIDLNIGHSLARALLLTPKQAVIARKIALKYRRQLPAELAARLEVKEIATNL